jgi:hypothetical protein
MDLKSLNDLIMLSITRYYFAAYYFSDRKPVAVGGA